MSDFIDITEEPLDVGAVSSLATESSTGATSIFVGTTRDNFEGKKVARLEYESYAPMAKKEIKKLCTKLRSEHPDVRNIVVHHRVGIVEVTEASVVIAISSEHRKASLDAVHAAINELKAVVPIWKKEIYENHTEGEWKANKECKWKDTKIRIEVDESEILMNCSKEELDRRIEDLRKRKRAEIDRANVLEFCNRHISDESNEYSCARVDSCVPKRKGSSSHLRFSSVLNVYGPQSEDRDDEDEESEAKKPKMSEEDEALPEGIRERVIDLEEKLPKVFAPNTPVPKDVYQRLKALEDRVRKLEKVSPEMFRSLQKTEASEPEPTASTSTSASASSKRNEEVAKSLSGINSRIEELRQSLKVKPEQTTPD